MLLGLDTPEAYKPQSASSAIVPASPDDEALSLRSNMKHSTFASYEALSLRRGSRDQVSREGEAVRGEPHLRAGGISNFDMAGGFCEGPGHGVAVSFGGDAGRSLIPSISGRYSAAAW